MGLGWQALGVFLGLEVVGCVVLVLPLPLDTKRSLLQFLSSSPYVAKAQTYLWVIFFILLALFVDSAWDARTAGNRLNAHYDHSHAHEHAGTGMHDDVHALEAHLYVAQRNAFFTGISLFLLVFVSVVTSLFRLEQNAEILKKQAKNQETAFVQHTEDNEKLREKVKELQAALDEAEGKLNSNKMLAKQAENQQKEYTRILEENERLQGEIDSLNDRLTAKSRDNKKND